MDRYDLDHPANDPDPHHYTNPDELENAGVPLGNTLIFNGAIVPTADTPVLRRFSPMVGCIVAFPLYLHGIGSDANPSDLFLGSAPTASAPKYMDSTSVKFTGGNVFKEIGTWTATPSAGGLSSAGDLHNWTGLKNGDDQWTRFDLRAELYKNGMLFAEGLTRCIQGVTRNPSSAEKVTVAFRPFPTTDFTGTDVLAEEALSAFEASAFGVRYPMIGKSWRANWQRVIPFLAFPREIRKVFYTTNAIESLNYSLRKIIKTRGHFPSEEAATKLLYLALVRAEQRWTMPIWKWKDALSQFAVHFDGRLAIWRTTRSPCETKGNPERNRR